MNCPPEVAEVVLDILQAGLLCIRASGWSGDDRRCAVEADHLHNLPALLSNYSPQLLRFYWDVERTSYLNEIGPESAAVFASQWKRLELLMCRELTPVLSH
jgi:hypothetical protein